MWTLHTIVYIPIGNACRSADGKRIVECKWWGGHTHRLESVCACIEARVYPRKYSPVRQAHCQTVSAWRLSRQMSVLFLPLTYHSILCVLTDGFIEHNLPIVESDSAATSATVIGVQFSETGKGKHLFGECVLCVDVKVENMRPFIRIPFFFLNIFMNFPVDAI